MRAHIIAKTRWIVAAGPFRGMRYVQEESWLWPVPNLIGSYESELNSSLETIIASRPSSVIDVGCAEGYYAVGLARRLPNVPVFAYDIDVTARRICTEMARINGVSATVEVLGECLLEDFKNRCSPGTFVILDCEGYEGYEVNLLRPDLIPELAHCTILVEIHDFIDPDIKPTLIRRFSGRLTQIIASEPRATEDWPLIHELSRNDQNLSLAEFRPILPTPMEWMIVYPV